jgi:hypothetical protein
MTAELIETVGAKWDLIPEINVISNNGDSVTFTFNQNLKSIADMVSVQYHTSVNELDCKVMLDVTEGTETELTAYCNDGVTAVSIYVYVGDSFVSEECEACEAPDDGATDIVAYYFEVPCESGCDSSASPSSAPPSSSPAPTRCEENMGNAELIERVGAEWDAIPEIIIASHDGESVTFIFNQNIKSIADMVSVHYHVNMHETDCKIMLDVAEGTETELTAYCVNDVTSVSIYVYVGDSFVAEECEACEAPADGATDIVAYYFELPCVYECEPEELSASEECYSQLNVTLIEKLGADQDTIPEINIASHDGESVTFIFNQNIKSIADMVSVHYHTNLHETDCKIMLDVAEGTETEFTAYCVNEVTAVSIYVYVGDSFVAEECEACEAPADGATDIVAYYFEVSCMSECASSVCIENNVASPDETIGAPTSLPDDAVKIVSQNGQTIEFQVTQLWHDGDAADMIAVLYHSSSGETDCDMQLNVAFDVSKTYTAHCVDNYSAVSVYVYVGDSFVEENCEACQAPADDATDLVAYYFELPCVSNCDDVIDCYDGPYLPPTGTEGSCMYSEIPIAIEGHSTDGSFVEFTVEHTWYDMTQYGSVEPVGFVDSMDFIATRYTSVSGDEDMCVTKTEVGSGLIQTNTFTAKCVNNVAEVWIYVQDDESLGSSGANVADAPSGCGDIDFSKNVCSYYFQLPCKEELLCPTTGRKLPAMDDILADGKERRMPKSPISGSKVEPDSESFTAKAAAASVNNPTDENYSEDLPYCVTEDFPCEGDEENMVYVCHYNARKGYQTFCVPERDSDILRFYPNDYCGPCEGGYGAGIWK